MFADRGGEFTLTNFKAACEEARIKRQLTTALTPQQNNRTIKNMVRCMLEDTKVPKEEGPETEGNENVSVPDLIPTQAVEEGDSSALEEPSFTEFDSSNLNVEPPAELGPRQRRMPNYPT
ncbi:hypothetical protein V2J09_001090 [Rumex salicifolius]